ncbi:MAG: cryptochrome/photolyase family protein [Phycisphaerae bacterium]
MGTVLHWFRRDFRARDNTALAAACRMSDAVVGAFCIDRRWFSAAAEKTGAFQATFWLESLKELSATLARLNIPLKILTTDDPVKAILTLAKTLSAQTVTLNKEYEPGQMAQDQRLSRQAAPLGIEIKTFKDAVIFEECEVLTGTENPYTIFSPYKRAWLGKLAPLPPQNSGLPNKFSTMPLASDIVPEAASLGYAAVTLPIAPGESGATKMLETFSRGKIGFYRKDRDIPAIDGVSRLSAHLAAGTISIRQCVAAAVEEGALSGCGGAETWLSELIWREFYRMILFHFPHTAHSAFQKKYESLSWENNPDFIAAWSTARTGYPIVDAAIRQIQQTGWMHNRLRMITAMFLTKDLDTHWRIGEQLFMQWLMDYDQASNVGGWQWSAGTGTDAAPYFRVMNPILQAQRFDPDGIFVKRYIAELAKVPKDFIHTPWEMPPLLQSQCGCIIGQDYPARIVDHATARIQAIAKFRA